MCFQVHPAKSRPDGTKAVLLELDPRSVPSAEGLVPAKIAYEHDDGRTYHFEEDAVPLEGFEQWSTNPKRIPTRRREPPTFPSGSVWAEDQRQLLHPGRDSVSEHDRPFHVWSEEGFPVNSIYNLRTTDLLGTTVRYGRHDEKDGQLRALYWARRQRDEEPDRSTRQRMWRHSAGKITVDLDGREALSEVSEGP